MLLDEQNRPVKNTGITLLLDQSGKPVLNSKSRPILIDSEGKPINLESNDLNIPLNSLINPELYYQNPQGQMNNNKLIPKQKPPYYEKINSVPKKSNKKIPKKDDQKSQIKKFLKKMMIMLESQKFMKKNQKIIIIKIWEIIQITIVVKC